MRFAASIVVTGEDRFEMEHVLAIVHAGNEEEAVICARVLARQTCPCLTGYVDHSVKVACMEDTETLAMFQARKIKERRGWYSVPHVRRGMGVESWMAINTFGVEIERGGNTGVYFISDDPDTCLVEADKWLTEYEKKAVTS